MYKNKTILAVIPARGGSKGFKRKNIRKFAGKPLIAWTIKAAHNSKYIDRIILSSEDSEIISVAKKWGCEVPFIRPRKLSMDKTPGIAPILHAIRTLPEKYDFIVMLQPTSPLRHAEDIDGCLTQCISGGHKSCISVTEPEKSPFWMYRLDKRGMMHSLLKLKKTPSRRQDLPKTFAVNGAVYAADCKSLLEKRSFFMQKTSAYKMPSERSVDIDSSLDLAKAEVVYKFQKHNAK